ncbi:MAG TPA: hypothetical protein P5568_10805 [Acidobacteriota bacterium]|nr:hypothetical protein [Acidobacteriota bacterium]HRV08944.1 hypothetical protein [Acidobacteriota bacterium]
MTVLSLLVGSWAEAAWRPVDRWTVGGGEFFAVRLESPLALAAGSGSAGEAAVLCSALRPGGREPFLVLARLHSGGTVAAEVWTDEMGFLPDLLGLPSSGLAAAWMAVGAGGSASRLRAGVGKDGGPWSVATLLEDVRVPRRPQMHVTQDGCLHLVLTTAAGGPGERLFGFRNCDGGGTWESLAVPSQGGSFQRHVVWLDFADGGRPAWVEQDAEGSRILVPEDGEEAPATTVAAELPGRRVYRLAAAARGSNGVLAWLIRSVRKVELYTSFSSDAAKTWSKPELMFEGSPWDFDYQVVATTDDAVVIWRQAVGPRHRSRHTVERVVCSWQDAKMSEPVELYRGAGNLRELAAASSDGGDGWAAAFFETEGLMMKPVVIHGRDGVIWSAGVEDGTPQGSGLVLQPWGEDILVGWRAAQPAAHPTQTATQGRIQVVRLSGATPEPTER